MDSACNIFTVEHRQKLIYGLSNYAIADDLKWPLEVITATVNFYWANILKNTTKIAYETNYSDQKSCELLYLLTRWNWSIGVGHLQLGTLLIYRQMVISG